MRRPLLASAVPLLFLAAALFPSTEGNAACCSQHCCATAYRPIAYYNSTPCVRVYSRCAPCRTVSPPQTPQEKEPQAVCTLAPTGQRFTVVDTKIGVLLVDNERLKMYQWNGKHWDFMSNLPTN